jgi:hypothetical protein
MSIPALDRPARTSGPPEFVILHSWPVASYGDLVVALADAHDRAVEDSDDFSTIERIRSSMAGPITSVILAKAERPKGGALYAIELS